LVVLLVPEGHEPLTSLILRHHGEHFGACLGHRFANGMRTHIARIKLGISSWYSELLALQSHTVTLRFSP
jgi:hypothetical protein